MPEQLYGIAIGATRQAQNALQGLERVLRAAGYSDPPAEYDRQGEYLQAVALSRVDGGSWLLVEEQLTSRLGLAQDLAAASSEALDVIEVSAIDAPKGTDDGELAYEVDVRCLRVLPDRSLGSPQVATTYDDSGSLRIAHGDFYETVSFVLQNAIEGALPPEPDVAGRIRVYRANPEEALSGRLAGIAANLSESSDAALETMEGLTFLKLALPAGSRLVRVSPSELEQLRALCPGKLP